MKIAAYFVMWIGFIGLVFSNNREQQYGGAILMLIGFVVYVVVRLLNRIDPDGAED